MKNIGIIGGLGPEATVDYYKEIIGTFNKISDDLVYPEIIIYSVNMSKFLGMMKDKEYDGVVEYLGGKINALAGAGAEFAALSANTPHLLFDRLNEYSPIPLISIVEATCKDTLKRGLKRPGLFGTGFTMNATFYQEAFQKRDIDVILPDPDDKEILNQKLFTEIELGIFKDETRELIISIIQKMKETKKIDSLILGCTEFPLILPESEYAGIPMLNTTKIHVAEIVSYCKATY